jgi:hypothetical protein
MYFPANAIKSHVELDTVSNEFFNLEVFHFFFNVLLVNKIIIELLYIK